MRNISQSLHNMQVSSPAQSQLSTSHVVIPVKFRSRCLLEVGVDLPTLILDLVRRLVVGAVVQNNLEEGHLELVGRIRRNGQDRHRVPHHRTDVHIHRDNEEDEQEQAGVGNDGIVFPDVRGEE